MRMSFYEAKEVIRDCVCSACWGQLDYTQPDKDNPNLAEVKCQYCGTGLLGFISKKWMQKQQQTNAVQAIEARRALRDLLPWLKPVETTEEGLLQALGYSKQ
jgi:DNA-directed RNA polymerase subunit RPC12/RpoP